MSSWLFLWRRGIEDPLEPLPQHGKALRADDLPQLDVQAMIIGQELPLQVDDVGLQFFRGGHVELEVGISSRQLLLFVVELLAQVGGALLRRADQLLKPLDLLVGQRRRLVLSKQQKHSAEHTHGRVSFPSWPRAASRASCWRPRRPSSSGGGCKACSSGGGSFVSVACPNSQASLLSVRGVSGCSLASGDAPVPPVRVLQATQPTARTIDAASAANAAAPASRRLRKR